MITWAILIFLVPFLAGGLVFRFSEFSQRFSSDLLTFGGAFLFTITLLHLLPEVFAQSTDAHRSGLWLLIGFLIQTGLEILFGSEHDNKSLKINPLPFLLAVFFHAFTEGGLLGFSEEQITHAGHNHSHHHHHEHGNDMILFLGVLFHKIPTAMMIVSIFLAKYAQKKMAFLGLLIMVLATPMGMFMYDFLSDNQILTQEFGQILSPLVAGSFLHVASILFFNSMHENTQQKYRKPLLIMIGTGIGIMSEFLF